MTDVLYINLDRDVPRRRHIEDELEKGGLNGERIAGVEGLDVPPLLRDYFFKPGWRPSTRLKHGEIGCYASHLVAWRTVIARGWTHALVIEDDVMLPPHLALRLVSIVQTLPRGWDFVHLSAIRDRSFRPLERVAHGHRLARYSRFPASSTAYLISHAGALKLLRPELRVRPVDHDTRRPWHWHLDCYGVEPRVITWDGRFDSAIDAEGGHSRLRRGWKSAWGHPIRNPKGLIWNLKKLGLTWWLWCFLKNTKLRIGRELVRAQTKLGALTIKTAAMTDNDSGGEN